MIPKLMQIKRLARKLGIKGEINNSTRKQKKYMIEVDGLKIHFGEKGYDDYLDHRNEKRRENFHKRFKNNKGYNDPKSGLYYSARLLW